MQNLVYLMILSQGSIRFLSQVKLNVPTKIFCLTFSYYSYIELKQEKKYPFWTSQYLLNKNGKTQL